MKVFVWSDNHFFHNNIIKYCNRPFEYSNKGSLDCLKSQINNYLKCVSKDDIVLFLGDLLSFKCNIKKFEEMFNKLPGHKILILGNHDSPKYDYKRLGFEHILKYLIVNKTMFCHYPLTENSEYLDLFKENNCDILYHGHVHDKEIASTDLKRINCCVDYKNNNYTPLEITDNCLKNHILKYFNQN